VPGDLLCFSHLRWDFVFQRPNHLMERAARDRRVFFVEEWTEEAIDEARVDTMRRGGVTVVVPRLPGGLDWATRTRTLAGLIDDFVARERIDRPVLWYYTPMALPWTQHLDGAAVVYDCMDHLAGFRNAPPGLLELERELVARADVVFTGGAQLFEAKRDGHRNAHCFPSSVDVAHFGRAREHEEDPADQAAIARPRIGYVGVIDERLDMELLRAVATSRPGWQLILVGPTAKIDPATVPAGPNVHRLGMRSYADLPSYLAGWDVAIMPFAHNDATRYISPTKTPEYLAAGLPVVSTSIHDVVVPYGRDGLVEIGDGPSAFTEAIERALRLDREDLRRRADSFLGRLSWDRTWSEMAGLIEDAVAARAARERVPTPIAVWSPALPTRSVRAPSTPAHAAAISAGVRPSTAPTRAAGARPAMTRPATRTPAAPTRGIRSAAHGPRGESPSATAPTGSIE
jgi:UDP-galactopyranose mutase